MPGVKQTPDWPELPGLIYMGTLTIATNNMKKRHFALFDSRLDYFEMARDMAAERYPRGRILLRDIQNLEFLDNCFQLSFEDPDLPPMVLLVDRKELSTWEIAFAKVGLPRQAGTANTAWDEYQEQRQNAQRSPNRPPKPALTIHGALMEGYLGLVRPHSSGSGRPEPRFLVLYSDRLDCFIDETAAKRGRVLESIMKAQIQDIDIVDDGFNIVSNSRAGRPVKLRGLQGVVPDVEDWVEAFTKAFAR